MTDNALAKKTVVLGATPNPARFAYVAVRRLQRDGIETVPVGIRQGEIDGTTILRDQPEIENVHTVTLYLNPERQKAYYDYIFSLHPQRIIYNPGTENGELMRLATERGIENEVACTLVMLASGSY